MVKLVGLNKSRNQASVAQIKIVKNELKDFEIRLRERSSRIKNYIDLYLEEARQLNYRDLKNIAETSFGKKCSNYEQELHQQFDYYDIMKQRKLDHFLSYYNKQIEFVSHHWAHAMSAVAMSPFKKTLILIMDSIGSNAAAFDKKSPEFNFVPKNRNKNYKYSETQSLYSWDGARLSPLDKQWAVNHAKSKEFKVASIGNLYEYVSKHIFGKHNESGKTMGLAPLGKPKIKIKNYARFLKMLPKAKACPEKISKKKWEKSKHLFYYKNLASSLQQEYENKLIELLKHYKKKYPEYENIILGGGCALNCVANAKVNQMKIFKNIYVPPFPGDEGVAFGAAYALALKKNFIKWKPLPYEKQIAYWGPKKKYPLNLRKINKSYQIITKNSLSRTAQLLAQGKIISYFQGRSEVGPRALGHRSVLSHPGVKGRKDFLNNRVKMRESFRPYGATCLDEFKSTYFDVQDSFFSPFMSFTAPVRKNWQEKLSEVCHVDCTSRIQTLKQRHNPEFYRLIKLFGDLTGVYCLLNTSLNVMGEPIVETVDEAMHFLNSTPTDGILIGRTLILK